MILRLPSTAAEWAEYLPISMESHKTTSRQAASSNELGADKPPVRLATHSVRRQPASTDTG